MYFEDLSAYAYGSRPKTEVSCRAKNVGWLDAAHEFPTAQPSTVLLDRLWTHCRVIVSPTRGFHSCELCAVASPTFARHGARLLLGSGEIRVFSGHSEIFAAPNLIFHYVDAHQYCPPPAFVRAVTEGPAPASQEYERLLELHGFSWRENAAVDEEPERFRFLRTQHGVVRVKA